ncbi:hypothetical protein D3C80_1676370 [compost metagenome]
MKAATKIKAAEAKYTIKREVLLNKMPDKADPSNMPPINIGVIVPLTRPTYSVCTSFIMLMLRMVCHKASTNPTRKWNVPVRYGFVERTSIVVETPKK